MTEAPVSAVKAAEAAWERYRSTCWLGGSAEQRTYAFEKAMHAEHRVWAAEGAGAARA